MVFGGDFNTVTRSRDGGSYRDKLIYDSVALNSVASKARLVDIHIRSTPGHEGSTITERLPGWEKAIGGSIRPFLEEAEIGRSFEDFLQGQEPFLSHYSFQFLVSKVAIIPYNL